MRRFSWSDRKVDRLKRLTDRVTDTDGTRCRFKVYCICKCCFIYLLSLHRKASYEFVNMPFPHTRMFPLESPVMVFPFSANVTHSTNLGFSCFCREDKKGA